MFEKVPRYYTRVYVHTHILYRVHNNVFIFSLNSSVLDPIQTNYFVFNLLPRPRIVPYNPRRCTEKYRQRFSVCGRAVVGRDTDGRFFLSFSFFFFNLYRPTTKIILLPLPSACIIVVGILYYLYTGTKTFADGGGTSSV